jgi:methyl-accepting chemotaxis protein
MSESSGLSLKAKLLLLSIVNIVALVLLVVVFLHSEKSQLMLDRQEKIRNLVEVAHATVSHFEKQARDGKLPADDAKKAAMSAVREMRYDKNEYFWINDFTPTTLMHPIRPELEGKAMSEVKDPTGKVLFVEFVKVVKASGAGYVDYLWPKPGSEAPVPKISYVKGFEPWGWIIGTGVYTDDVDAVFAQEARRFLIWGVVMGALITLALFMVSRNLIATLGGDPHYAVDISRRIAAGDLTTRVNVAPGDDQSLLARMNEMQETLRRMIGEIVGGAERLSSAAGDLLKASEEVAMRSGQQHGAASAMAAAVEEMTVSIDQVSHNAGEAHGISVQAGEMSERGTGIIQSAAVEMEQIANAVQSSSQIIEELGQQSDQITSIVNTIREIADQTNLLALNAAIEAARAGEQGRGFAVVADEVRKLAERTSLSTTEIAGMVAKIQNGTRNAVSSMQAGVAQADKGVKLANEAGQSIISIRDGALRVVQVVNDISSSIREQSSTSSNIAKNIENIARMSEEGASAVQHTTDAARRLQELSTSLHSAVSRFKTS